MLVAGSIERPLLTLGMADCLVDFLPVQLRLPGVQWKLLYTPKAHGVSMSTLYRNVADSGTTIVIMQDSSGIVCGGCAHAVWEPCKRFFGSGECFVFSIGTKSARPEAQVYTWTSRNSFFMYADHETLGFGGGSGHYALAVGGDLLKGYSSPTPTYGNPTLAASEEFVVRDIEFWGLSTEDDE
eukprot:TRINITY_DN29846_c0_g1_i1.p1 TRINITY_DN29846_c0_g1~~TRINITY_DN29846_c0_g1_i1.p1  ORF type:complete len:183 (-),score=18.58 TRINITY_DN29846_c0_g1_i1:127-675(-)